MNTPRAMALVILASLAAGCANEPRSRDTANPNVSGKTLALQVCSNCHGVSGNSISPQFPNLAGQQEAYLVAQLTGFKSHGRRDPAGYEYMWGLSHKLTDTQIRELAAYFSAQPLRRRSTEEAPQRIQAGELIFSAGLPAKTIPPCSTCHGPKGEGNAVIPRIAGQHADYLVKQLKVFQRTNERPEGAVMKTVAHGLSEDEIEVVAAYLQAMPLRALGGSG